MFFFKLCVCVCICVWICAHYSFAHRGPKCQIPWRWNYRQLWAPWCGCLIQFRSLDVWLTTELSLELLIHVKSSKHNLRTDPEAQRDQHPSGNRIPKKGSLLIPPLPHLSPLLALPPPLTVLPPSFLLLNPVLGIVPKTLPTLDRCTATELILSPYLFIKINTLSGPRV